MGSLGNIKKRIKDAVSEMRNRRTLSPSLVFKLMQARDKVLRKQLGELGIQTNDTRDQAVIKNRMHIAGVTMTSIKQSADDPRDNFLVLSKSGRPVVAISEPFMDGGKIHVRVIEPSRIATAGIA